MKKRIGEINLSIDRKIKDACERIPQKKRKITVMVLCFLFVAFFVFMLVDVFYSEGIKEMIKIEHISPLDLPQDTLTNHSQWLRY
jgi:hypothetical protein